MGGEGNWIQQIKVINSDIDNKECSYFSPTMLRSEIKAYSVVTFYYDLLSVDQLV